jgi:hypothetical protein
MIAAPENAEVSMATKKKSPKPAPADDKPKKEEAGKAAEENWLVVPSKQIDGSNA